MTVPKDRNIPNQEEYFQLFRGHVYELLGGLDMAEAFFSCHPRLAALMREQSDFHYHKGGPPSAWSGAQIFRQYHLQPALDKDRVRAMRPRS